jgi:oxygen-independent coproporphyrinogen-3 oxidase
MEERQKYVESLCQRIRSYEELAKAYHVVSVFVGGGTPSILEAEQMQEIFLAIGETFLLDEDAEITVEMNPGTVTREKLQAYKSCGINRLSIGLQSTDDQELAALGRIHTYREFLETYRMAREAGFANVNVDLMSAIPYQTAESWRNTLRRVAELTPPPEHISAYSLIIEEGTPFYERYVERTQEEDPSYERYVERTQEEDPSYEQDVEKTQEEGPSYERYVKETHEEELPDEDTERRMYQDTKQILETYGYRRYEISNYAKEGYECRHNLGYWDRVEYLGIGLGAASLIDNCRFAEERDYTSYMRSDCPAGMLECACKDTAKTWGEISIETFIESLGDRAERLSVSGQMEEYMFLGLRKTSGVSVRRFETLYGRNIYDVYGTVIAEMSGKGLLETEGDFIRLTEHGLDVSNYVMSGFLLE